MFPFTRTVQVFFIAGLLFCALSTSNIGSVSHPAETGLLIPSDKGEVGGSSPPRPTIQITNKYAAILAFSISRNIARKAFCQRFVNFRNRHTAPDVTGDTMTWRGDSRTA